MRRPLLLAVVGLAGLATGCLGSSGSPSTAPAPVMIHRLVPRHMAHAVAVKPVSQQAKYRAILVAATKSTLHSGSAEFTITAQLPGVRSVNHLRQDTPVLIAGDLDFVHAVGHAMQYVDPFGMHAVDGDVFISHNNVYGVDSAGNADATKSVVADKTFDNPSSLVNVVSWVAGPIKDSGWHNLPSGARAHVYTYHVSSGWVNWMIDGLPKESTVAQALSGASIVEHAYIDSSGRIAALVDNVDISGRVIPGIPSTATQLVVVTNFSDFHVQLYQHLDQKGAPATSPTPVHLPSAG